MLENDLLRASAGHGPIKHLALNFDIQDDITVILSQLGKLGGGYKEAIDAAEKNREDDPELTLQILRSTLDIASGIDELFTGDDATN